MKTERTVWVAYIQDEGFAQGKGNSTDDFRKARVYNQKNHLTSSVGSIKIDNGTVIPVPIKMSIDPEIMTVLRLGGKPIFE